MKNLLLVVYPTFGRWASDTEILNEIATQKDHMPRCQGDSEQRQVLVIIRGERT